MKNIKEIFNKIKFLITLAIGITLMVLANQTGKFDASFGYVIFGIAAWISVLQFRFAFNEEYRKKATKHYQKQQKLPWHQRYAFYPIVGAINMLWILSLFLIGVTVVYFFHTGVTTGVWKIGQTVIYVTILSLVFIACRNSFKK